MKGHILYDLNERSKLSKPQSQETDGRQSEAEGGGEGEAERQDRSAWRRAPFRSEEEAVRVSRAGGGAALQT